MDSFTIPGYVLDIKDILCKYKDLNKSDFASFKKLWESMHFSFIHGARPEMFSKKEWIERLFVACYGYFYVEHLPVKCGSIYLLYTLYQTQPGKIKYKIPISFSLWKELKDILEECRKDNPDVCLVYKKMVSELNAFSLSAQVNIVPPPSTFFHFDVNNNSSISNFDTLSHVIDLDSIKQVSDRYNALMSHIEQEEDDNDIYDQLKILEKL